MVFPEGGPSRREGGGVVWRLPGSLVSPVATRESSNRSPCGSDAVSAMRMRKVGSTTPPAPGPPPVAQKRALTRSVLRCYAICVIDSTRQCAFCSLINHCNVSAIIASWTHLRVGWSYMLSQHIQLVRYRKRCCTDLKLKKTPFF